MHLHHTTTHARIPSATALGPCHHRKQECTRAQCEPGPHPPHSLILKSAEADTILAPSGENPTECTAPVWALVRFFMLASIDTSAACNHRTHADFQLPPAAAAATRATRQQSKASATHPTALCWRRLRPTRSSCH
eukprot:5140787-Prymnesium_polylepis.1